MDRPEGSAAELPKDGILSRAVGDRTTSELERLIEPSEVNPADLTHLVASLQAYHGRRQSQPMGGYDERQMEVLRASCLTLILGPPELGIDMPASELREQAYTILRGAALDDMPEVRVCSLWLSCAAGERKMDAADRFASLAKQSLWEPVRALAYRALAYFGRRNSLMDLLPKDGPLSVVQADVWLEATQAAEIDEQWTERILPAPEYLLPKLVSDQWISLLAAETALACGVHPEAAERNLAVLASLAIEHPPRTYGEAETQRIALRAAAALARTRVAQWCDVGDALTTAAGQLVPVWEREYLHALAWWQLNEPKGAALRLKAALERNPHQTCIRLALAALLAAQSPEAALELLEYSEPTREIFISRAALLARLGRYEEAENALAHCEVERTWGSESLRYSWARGKEQYRQREGALRTAIAERRGDWSTASMAWQSAGYGARQKTLQDARQLFAAHRGLESLAVRQGWRRDLVEQRLKHGVHEIGTIPLMGDALFFRAAALIDVLPDRAVKDFQTLLRRRAWVDAERCVGGGRIIFVGDVLLRLGYVQDAIRAYELVGAPRLPEVGERLAVALVYAEVLGRPELQAISKALDRAAVLAPTSPWPQLLAALGLLMAGDGNAAMSCVDAADRQGAPGIICRCLRSVFTSISGTATVTEEDLAALQMSEEANAIVRLLCRSGTEPAKIKKFIQTFGDEWVVRCPTDSHLTALRLLAAWCDEGNWDEALKFAAGLVRSGLPWGKELASLVRVRRALDRASRGELEEAERELGKLEA